MAKKSEQTFTQREIDILLSGLYQSGRRNINIHEAILRKFGSYAAFEKKIKISRRELNEILDGLRELLSRPDAEIWLDHLGCVPLAIKPAKKPPVIQTGSGAFMIQGYR